MKAIHIKPENIEDAVQGLKAISHPARLTILCSLQDRDSTVNQIVELTGMSQSAVSQHLAKMKAFGVLKDRRDGNRVYYSLTNENFVSLVNALCVIYNK
ncbi:MAG: metalloregulator ArsR/SmtB family transcription factor [Spirochaetia bacterium]|nr:metalloregulator ArsR/SmtB family transcription factor [Spirochaetia bacterium]